MPPTGCIKATIEQKKAIDNKLANEPFPLSKLNRKMISNNKGII